MKWLLALLALLLLNSAAAIQIFEIMYDLPGSDTSREWVEIYNNNSISENLTGWKFFEGGTNHGLTLTNGSWILNAGAYAIIADNSAIFLQDNPDFAGTLFDSSFSLSNTGEQIGIKNSSLDFVESITYNSSWGANGDNNSLQLYNGNWCEGNPTPGSANACDAGDNNDSNDEEAGQNLSQEEKYDLKLEVKIQNATQGVLAKNLFKLTNLDYETNQPYMNVTVEFTVKFNNSVEYTDEFTVEFKQSKSTGTGTWTPQSFGKYELCGKITESSFNDSDTSNNEICKDIDVYENQEFAALTEDENESVVTEKIVTQNTSADTEHKSAGTSVWRSGSTAIGVAFWLFTAILLVFVVLLLLMFLRKQNP